MRPRLLLSITGIVPDVWRCGVDTDAAAISLTPTFAVVPENTEAASESVIKDLEPERPLVAEELVTGALSAQPAYAELDYGMI